MPRKYKRLNKLCGIKCGCKPDPRLATIMINSCHNTNGTSARTR